MAYTFRHIGPTEVNWAIIEQSSDANCFFSQQWCNFLSTIGCKTFIVQVWSRDALYGHFIGVKRNLLIDTIGAPTDGTGTFTQGLCMLNPISTEERLAIYQDLWKWICKQHIARYMQVCDWQLRSTPELPLELPDSLHCQPRATLVVDTRKPEDTLWADLHYKSCKYSINKARKLGLTVKQISRADDIPAFVEKHYEQLLDVCHRKGMQPQPYQRKERMLKLCRSLFPDHIIMLQVEGNGDDGERHIMSSAIFCPGREASTYFTGASNQRWMKYCPNELMVWEAMRLMSFRGAGNLIFGGTAHYKTKFGTSQFNIPMIIFSRYRILLDMRITVKRLYSTFREKIAKLKHIP